MRRQPGHPVLITGTGSYLPGAPVPYEDIDRVLGELDQADPDLQRWYTRAKATMRQLLGMEVYYFALDPETRQPTETPSTLAAKAAERALQAAGMKASDIDILFYAGCSQDAFICPPTSAFVQQHLGIEVCAEMSIHANCTSTYKAIQVAADQIALGRYDTALVTTASMVSGHARAETLNQHKLTRHQALLRLFMCDGGGALVLTRDDGRRPAFEVYDTFVESVGGRDEPRMSSRYGSASVAPAAIAAGDHHVTQDMSVVGGLGVERFVGGVQRFLEQLGVDTDDPEFRAQATHLLANVPSEHLVETGLEDLSARYRVSMDHLRSIYTSTVAKRGYTGPAAVAITLDGLLRDRAVADGKFVLSFVTESSKWMNAGFALRYRA